MPDADPPAERPSWLPDTPGSRARSEACREVGPPPDAILSAYDWSGMGSCVSCGRRKWTTSVRSFVAPGGRRPQPVLMCAACVLDEERVRWRRCVERGIEYIAGRIGRPM